MLRRTLVQKPKIPDWENKVKTSGKPSRYQTGEVRYIGGEIRYWREGLDSQESSKASLTSWSNGSMRWVTDVGPSSTLAMKLVRQDRRQTVEDSRTWPRHSMKIPTWPQGINCAALMEGLARHAVWLICRLMLESPRSEWTQAWAIAEVDEDEEKKLLIFFLTL